MKAFVLKLEENLLNQSEQKTESDLLKSQALLDSNYTSLWTWIQ